MTSKQSFVIALGLTLGAGLATFGCSESGVPSAGVSQSQLVGKWRQTSFMGKPTVEGGLHTTFDLQADSKVSKTGTLGQSTSVDTGTWQLSGSVLTLALTQMGAVEYTVTSVSGSIMKLKLMGLEIEWTKE